MSQPLRTKLHIGDAQFPEHLDAVREIFREYAANLEIDLSFQNFASELADLPGKYSAPNGRVLLAWRDGQAIGCVAMRPFEGRTCEMKRLYVCPEGRGLHLGKQLAQLICSKAKEAGYQRIRLDTLPTMNAALKIYVSLGFKPIPAYVFNPIGGTKYLELDLSTWQPGHSPDSPLRQHSSFCSKGKV